MIKKLFEKEKQANILDEMVFDFESHRHFDANGRLLVDQTLITKACVSEYYGKEIPNYEALGLEPYVRYKVLRPAEELQKALPLFNNIPLLNKHIMDYADEPQKENRCGGLSNSTYKEGGIYSDLSIWDKADIDRIQSGELKDLSCGYRCQFVKESGEYNGEHYDLKMVDIIPNHLALVKKGRVDGAYVYDEKKGASMFDKLANLFKKLGVKDEDLEELKTEIESKDLEEKSNGVGENAAPKEQKMEEVKKEEKDLTKDAAHEDKRKLIDEIGGILKGKVDEEILRTILGKVEEVAYNGSETSETDDEEPVKKEIVEENEEEKLKKIKDEAKEEAKKELTALNSAKEEVEDVCGKIGTQDSREAYYKIGCEALGLSTKGICDSAFEPMFKGAVAIKKQSAKKAVVLDEEASAKIKKDFDGVLAGLPKRKFN